MIINIPLIHIFKSSCTKNIPPWCEKISPAQNFPALALLTFGGFFLCCSGCPDYYRIFSSIPNSYPLSVAIPVWCDDETVSRH